MFIGNFTANTTSERTIQRRTQILQLLAEGVSGSDVDDFFSSTLEVWNDVGRLIPPMTFAQLAVLNGDEYAVQVSLNSASAGGTYTIVIDIELCDEGGLNKFIYTKCVNNLSSIAIQLSSVDPMNATAVRVRKYNSMTIVSPAILPKNSLCIIPYASLLQLQKNQDLMSFSEILTHSNRILTDGVLREVHPVLYDYANSTPAVIENSVYTELAKSYVMGYGVKASANVIIWTGNDDFSLYPVSGGCNVVYCEKCLTEIALQVQQALAVSGNINNVDSDEFASAVMAVGAEAQRQNIGTSQTQAIANSVVSLLPSVRIAKQAGVRNFNLASESQSNKGVTKMVKI